jgi:hypothetical protein
MVPSGHLKILGSTKEALPTAAVAADAYARFAARRHRSGEPIATLCGNDDIPQMPLGSRQGAGKRESPRNTTAYTKV